MAGSGRKLLTIGLDARLVFYQKAGISAYTMGLIKGLARVVSDNERIKVFLSRKDRDTSISGHNQRACRLITPPHHRFEQFGLAAELKPRRLDLVHFPDFIPPFYRSCPAVVTVHDLAFLHFPHLLTRESAQYYGQIDRAVRSAEAVIAVSENTRRDLVDKVGANPDKVVVIPEAASERYQVLEPELVAATLRSHFGLEKGYLLFVGTIEPRKNLPFLLQAYAQLKGRWRSNLPSLPKLVIAGRQGWLYEEVYRTVEGLKLADDVVFLGGVGPDDLVTLYNGASMLIFPSLYEGFGLPLLEAMACGLPVVGANNSSIPEVIGDAGLLFTPGKLDSLESAIERLISDDNLSAELRDRGLERVREFSWEATARATLEVYRGLVG